MKGEWLLVRMKPRGNEKRENWLLRKVNDGFAGGTDDLVGRQLTSFLTCPTMAEIAGDEGGEQSLKGAKGAAFTKKMKAAAAHNRKVAKPRSEEHTPELQSLMRISYAVFCLKHKTNEHETKMP